MRTPLVKRSFPGAKPYVKDDDPRMAQLATARQVANALGVPVNTALRICEKNFERAAIRDDPSVTTEADRGLYRRADVIMWAEGNKEKLAHLRFTRDTDKSEVAAGTESSPRCGGEARSGDRCRLPAQKGSEFCSKHRDVKPSAVRERCAGTNKRGEHCGKMALRGSPFCDAHQDQAPPRTDELKVHLLMAGWDRVLCGQSAKEPLATDDPEKVTCRNCLRPRAGGLPRVQEAVTEPDLLGCEHLSVSTTGGRPDRCLSCGQSVRLVSDAQCPPES